MAGRPVWLFAAASAIMGAFVGYAVSLVRWPALGAWLATTLLTYGLVLAMVVGSGLLWVRRTAHETHEPAAISFDLVQEFIRVDAALTFGGLAYFLALGASPGATVPLAASGAVCGTAAIFVRYLRLGRRWSNDSERSKSVSQA